MHQGDLELEGRLCLTAAPARRATARTLTKKTEWRRPPPPHCVGGVTECRRSRIEDDTLTTKKMRAKATRAMRRMDKTMAAEKAVT